jgi:hypothetical protein
MPVASTFDPGSASHGCPWDALDPPPHASNASAGGASAATTNAIRCRSPRMAMLHSPDNPAPPIESICVATRSPLTGAFSVPTPAPVETPPQHPRPPY